MKSAINEYIDAEFTVDNWVDKQKELFDWCVEHMDTEIREQLHNKYAGDPIVNDAVFLEMYCTRHKAKFGSEFIVN